MIVVTQLDGRKMALNVDRVERVERNEATNDTNIYLIGGSRLTVSNNVDQIIEEIIDAKSRILARAFVLAGAPNVAEFPDAEHPPDPHSLLHVVPSFGDDRQ